MASSAHNEDAGAQSGRSSKRCVRDDDDDCCSDGGGDTDRSKRRSPDRYSANCTDDEDCYTYDNDDDCYTYGSGDDTDQDDAIMDDAEKLAKADDDGDASAKKSYRLLTEADMLAHQAEDTATTAEVLLIPPAFAAAVLHHFRWHPGRAQEEWFADDRRVRAAVGLPPDDGGPVATATALSARPLVCAICFDCFGAGTTRSAACGAHFYCDACWCGYIRAAVGDGARCLALRCPDPACQAAVVRDLVDAVADADDRDRYARFAQRSFVEESGGRRRWCPGRGCPLAVEFEGCAGDAADTEVLCSCGHAFCWCCGEEAHRPVSCGTVRAWLAKNKSDSETANWVLANTKHCPKCRRPIEKNQGCNHMTCRCGHHFCWLCLQPAGGYNDGHYACGIYRRPGVDASPPPAAAQTKEERTARQARASLDRYLFHYERWAANLKSLEKVREDMAELERSGLERMSAALGGRPVTQLAFLTEANERIAGGRRVLRWAHAYGYYLDPERVRDRKKRELFDHMQGEANAALERLHFCVEMERKELFRAAATGNDWGEAAPVVVEADVFESYKAKVMNLSKTTERFMGNLVKAFETDLPEVYMQ